MRRHIAVSVSLQLIPFAIAAFRPLKEEKTIQFPDIGITEYCTNMRDVGLFQTALTSLGAGCKINSKGELELIYKGFKAIAYVTASKDIAIRFNTLSEVHGRDIVQQIYSEYLDSVQSSVYERLIEKVEANNYKIESEVMNEVTQTISLTIVM